MKKRFIVFALLLTLFLAACETAQQAPIEAVLQDAPEPANELGIPAQSNDTAPAPESPVQAVAPEPKETFTIIQPTLTYPGAYNGPLYATSEQIGNGYPIKDYFANLNRNGVNWFIGFFTFESAPDADWLTTDSGLGYLITAVQKYPHRIIPYYNPGYGGEEVEPLVGSRLTTIYRTNLGAIKRITGSEFIRGLGEIETQEWRVAHNSDEVKQLFTLARTNGINAMYHPVAPKISQVDALAKEYPDITFIIHMYRSDLEQSRTQLIKILNDNHNVYYSIDAAHIAHSDGMDILYNYEKSPGFIAEFDRSYARMLSDAVSDYKPLVTGAPDKIMWGTEAGPEYSFEPAVYNRLIKISRELIGKMPEEHQDAVGYKNALRAFGQGVVFNGTATIRDINSWPTCTDAQIDACDTECEIPDTDLLTAEQNACFEDCLIERQCIDPEG